MAENYDFDVLVIGAGPGGYVAAIRAAQLGLRPPAPRAARRSAAPASTSAASRPRRCSTRPSCSRKRTTARSPRWGIKTSGVELDLGTMHGARKEAVKGLTAGHRVPVQEEQGRMAEGPRAASQSADTVKVGDRTVRAKNIVIATGSSVTPLPGVAIDQERIVDSDRRARAAAGAQAHGRDRRRRDRARARLGLAAARRARSPCVEFLDQILPGFDGDVRKEANKIFKKQGFEFQLSTKVTKARRARATRSR